ncbi:MAG TPA: YrdB family protein [Microlunatus sp.]
MSPHIAAPSDLRDGPDLLRNLPDECEDLSVEESESPGSLALGVVVFLVELVLLAVLAWSGARLGSPSLPLAILLAVVLPGVAALIWGRWLAPRATRRLHEPTRLIVKLALLAIAAGLLALSGVIVPAVAFMVLGGVIVCVGERSTRLGHRSSAGNK